MENEIPLDATYANTNYMVGYLGITMKVYGSISVEQWNAAVKASIAYEESIQKLGMPF